MRKIILSATIVALSLVLFAQELTHESLVINIEVPVRVFKGGTFIDDLTINDFEVYEDGVLQKLEAVYLVKETSIEREESGLKKEVARKKFAPQTSRHFALIFEIKDYLPKVNEAIDYFFSYVIKRGDTLTVMTPIKTYNLNKRALSSMPKGMIAKQLKDKLRKDTALGNSQYHSLIRDIRDLLTLGHSNLAADLSQVHSFYTQWKNLKYFDQKNLQEFADFLKKMEKQKHVFLFYQKEVLPQMNENRKSALMSTKQDQPHVVNMLRDLFEFYRRDITFDVDLIKGIFSDSSITSHFIYVTKTQNYGIDVTSMKSPSMEGIVFSEMSGDIFNAFKEIADATGGLTSSSANAAFSFKKAVDASENYYLLYYAPSNYKKDGKFKNIRVKVKGKSYRVTHRAGYFAN